MWTVSVQQDYLLSRAMRGGWDVSEALGPTDQDPRELACMLVREKLLDRLPMELPYTLKFSVPTWIKDEGMAVFPKSSET